MLLRTKENKANLLTENFDIFVVAVVVVLLLLKSLLIICDNAFRLTVKITVHFMDNTIKAYYMIIIVLVS